jgi:3',5'-cyclic-AMP phosphodiesterase
MTHETPDRRRFLECMAWAGTGLVWTVAGGAANSVSLDAAAANPTRLTPFSFVQISDSHIGFAKDPNPDARATLREAVAKIAAMPVKPAFILHTGDITQLSRDQEFDDADQILKEAGLPVFHVPGEHDLLDEGAGAAYLARHGKTTSADGWYSFDHQGAHFVGLVNVREMKAGGMGHLGEAQLTWLQKDLAGLGSSTPVVVFAHIPMWTIYADWGWGTDDSARALALLKRFGSLTVLNGHIHQAIHKLEGRVAFHTARSTAFPQPSPGQGAGPGPLKVAAGDLRAALGVRTVEVVRGQHPLTIIDTTLAV